MAAPASVPCAQDALDSVQRYPSDAVALAAQVLARDVPAAERSTAQRAMGLAFRELNDLVAARHHLRRAVRTAERAGSHRLAALARMSLGYVLASAGRNTEALRAVTAALPWLAGADAGRARMQRGVVLHYRGRYDEAVREYGRAVEIAQQEGDLLLEARARNNRGLLYAYRARGEPGGGDLERAAAIFQQLGLDLAAADTRWNAGIAAGQRGHVAGALQIFDAVEQEYRRLAVPRPALLLDRFELLLSVPLLEEAAAVAAAAVAELRRRRLASDLAEALLARSRVALLAGDLETAVAAARQAGSRFRRQARPVWAAFARHIELRATLRAGQREGTPRRSLLPAMARNADLLAGAGWADPALRMRIDAARLAVALGRTHRARELLTVAGTARRGGTASRRAQGWYAVALRRRLDGDERGAAAALQRGLAVLEQHRASLGATELRAGSGVHGQELAAEGLDIAVRSGDPAQVFGWAERWRAGALRMNPAVPPNDPRLAEALAELRAVSSVLAESTLDGRRTHRARRRQAALEQQIRDLSRQAEGGPPAATAPGVPEAAGALGEAVLVELVAHGERVFAAVIRDGVASLHDLGALDPLRHRARLYQFGLRRLAVLGDSGPARAGAAQAAAALDAHLFGPVRALLGDRPLVIVPLAVLHAISWSALPSCAGRPVTVAPSAAAWLRAGARGRGSGPPALIAGPRLPAADREVRALAAALPGARALTGAGATSGAALAALDGAGLAHIAAHGSFRADNPLFSTLELADGPLTAYELEGLHRPPDCVVLPACDSGLSAVRPGDELMGFTAGLLALGARTVIASVLPLPAEPTIALMLDLHRRIDAGCSPAAALAAAQEAGLRDADGPARATAAAFVCVGAG